MWTFIKRYCGWYLVISNILMVLMFLSDGLLSDVIAYEKTTIFAAGELLFGYIVGYAFFSLVTGVLPLGIIGLLISIVARWVWQTWLA